MIVTAVILTHNEAIHIARCIKSIEPLTADILVVDSGSTDDTLAIAARLGARTVAHPWRNYATQFNWGLGQVPQASDWVLRIDADEVMSAELAAELRNLLPALGPGIAGVLVNRRMAFMGKPIRYGGLFPTSMIRVFRNGRGSCENRWMDEHIKVDGECVAVTGEILDDNRNSLTWWTTKHNSYSNREAVDILNGEYGFIRQESISGLATRREADTKRWIKENVYNRLPSGIRAFAYFLYRYVVRLGCLDGKEGAAFHVLQGFWYRYLVDCKVLEVKKHMKARGSDPVTAIREVLGIDV
jgi:glycosyltransferase involved in cell wall biosynthesis